AFVRAPEKLRGSDGALTIVRGDPLNFDELRDAMPGHDAVLSALGAPGPGRTTILGDAATVTVKAMQSASVSRLLLVSVAVLFRHIGFTAAILRRTLLRNIAVDAAAMERTVAASDLDWTIVRPPRLTNGALTTRYRVDDGRMPAGTLVVSRADVAHFLLDELEDNRHVRAIVGMAGMERSTP
ncbi:MAG: NAD(P)H-binding protein, partial [Thermoanaerobaculia bacterium]